MAIATSGNVQRVDDGRSKGGERLRSSGIQHAVTLLGWTGARLGTGTGKNWRCRVWAGMSAGLFNVQLAITAPPIKILGHYQ